MDPTGPTDRDQVLFIFVAPVPGTKSVFHAGSETEHIPSAPRRINSWAQPHVGGSVYIVFLALLLVILILTLTSPAPSFS